MKKCFGILLLCLFAFNACEKDDFCTTTPVTPNLVIRFYDKDDITSVKSVSRLSVIAQSKTDSLIETKTLDSIAIPLNGLASETVYILKMNDAKKTDVECKENAIKKKKVFKLNEGLFLHASASDKMLKAIAKPTLI